jgi:hypothetical protein
MTLNGHTPTFTSHVAPSGTTAMIHRSEGFDVAVGRVLIYTLAMTGFTIIAHRYGIACKGTIPVIQRDGVNSLAGLFQRALIHHEHLAKTWTSGVQSYLTEGEITDRIHTETDTRNVDVTGHVMTDP